jgi:DNA-binding transcriptional LysR family regulator
MNIKQLESLVSIVENGGFAAAAERLHTTQSAVSARIKELEKYLGISLFDRSYHRARLTAKGEELLPYARQVVQLAQQVTRRVSDPNSLGGILRIGAVALIARTQLPQLMMEVRQRYPNVEMRVQIDLARTLLEKFQDGEIDLALTTAPVKESDVDVLPIGYDHFVWVTCPSRDVGNRILGPRDLEKWPVLGYPAESHHFPIINAWFSDNDVVYAPVISCNDGDVLANMTASGAGVALLPKNYYADLISEGRLRVLNTSPKISPVEFVAMYKRRALIHPITRTVAILASELGGQTGSLLTRRRNSG